jgi:hypothetical protein
VPDSDKVREIWSDRELDDMLAALYPDVSVDRAAQNRARATLMTAAGAGTTSTPQPAHPRTRRHIMLAGVAAAVVVVAVGAVLVVNNAASPNEISPAQSTSVTVPPRPPATTGSQHAPMPTMSDEPRNSLGNLAMRVPEAPPVPGQYRYVTAHGWNRVTTVGHSQTAYVFLAEYRTETWIPADQRQEWMVRNVTTGNRQWLVGTEQAALADEAPLNQRLVMPAGEKRARCGAFMAVRGVDPCVERPVGTVESMSGNILPSAEPRALYELLANDSATHSDPPLQFFRTASNLLDARFPANMRRAVLGALSHHPYVAVGEDTTKDGRAAVAVSIDYGEGSLREQVLLDPANGQLIGKRTTCLKDVDGAKAGDKIRDADWHETVVGEIGATG